MTPQYYAEHSRDLRAELARELPHDTLLELHKRRPHLHFAVAAALVGVLALSIMAVVLLDAWYLWLPFAIIAGFAMFNFTVLLHEVVHGTVFPPSTKGRSRWLGYLYAVPSGISATQFTRWHLDHHAGLGSDEEDPKRHFLSPKLNARWLKLLYFTPALIPIYFRASRKEGASYPADLRRKIALERWTTIGLHISAAAIVWVFAGGFIAWKAYLVPYLFGFPVAFALNRLGQHYDINPDDPAQWSTLVRGSRLWDIVFLCSNYHLEHHYFPGVPLYKLPRLQRLLIPFYERRGMRARSYGELFWAYIVLNRKPHTNWSDASVGELAEAGR
jgi:fatty acid desaturase